MPCPSVKALSRVSVLSERYRAAVALRVLGYDDKSRADMDALVAASRSDVAKAVDAYAPLITTEEKRRLAADVESRWAALLKTGDQILASVREGRQSDAVTVLFTAFRTQVVGFRNVLATDIANSERDADAATRSAADAYIAGRIMGCDHAGWCDGDLPADRGRGW